MIRASSTRETYRSTTRAGGPAIGAWKAGWVLTWDIDREAVAAANDLLVSSIVRVQTQLAGSLEAPRREREVPEPMDETSACQSGDGIFGIRPITEFARDLLEAPGPPGLVEEKADDGVVDLVL
jgi:hypothetical protein